MADSKSTLDWILQDHVSGPAAKMDKALGKAGSTAGGTSGHFGKLGAAISGMITPATLALGAVGVLTAGVGDALKHAADYEVVSARLNTTLHENVKGYDGNRDAIDGFIAKQMDLGFQVDATTASFAQLLTATGDVHKAQEYLTAAENLSRLRGIDLATATDAMTKASIGQTKALKSLGITVSPVTAAMDALNATHKKLTPAMIAQAKATDKAATEAEILAAVQKAAAGQAEAYAGTVKGKMEVLNAKWNDLMTKAGVTITDLSNKFAGFVVDVALPWIAKLQAGIAGVISSLINMGIVMATANSSNSAAAAAAAGGGAGKFGAPPSQIARGQAQASIGGSQQAAVGHGHTIVMDGKVVANAVDQHLYYMLKGSPATRMRN